MISDKLTQRAHELTELGKPFVTATVVRVQHPTSVEPGTVALVRLSGGALEIFLEPLLPAPRVTVAGDSPIAAALRSLGPELGLELRTGSPSADDLALVIAAHGRDELGALRAGLEVGVPYVGLVASRKRGAAVIDELRADGVAEELLGAIETPAGIDIGARTPAEIALSILARIVAARREHRAPVAQHARTAVDPVCGMTVVIGPDTPSAQRNEETVYFCCEGCMNRFAA
jgi:xanthine dehydrogenase accessory factor